MPTEPVRGLKAHGPIPAKTKSAGPISFHIRPQSFPRTTLRAAGEWRPSLPELVGEGVGYTTGERPPSTLFVQPGPIEAAPEGREHPTFGRFSRLPPRATWPPAPRRS